MKIISLALSLGLFGFAELAGAAPSWHVTSFATNFAGGSEIVAALDKVVASPLGQQFKGRIVLQRHLADGVDPATHSLVSLFPSSAEREAFEGKFPGNSDYAAFMSTFEKHAQVTSTVRYTPRKSWGDLVDTDQYWEIYPFVVRDPKAFTAALDQFMNSETAKKFPGQVHLISTAAGGMGGPSHGIGVGFASAAEAEIWTDMAETTADWQTLIDAMNKNGNFLGGIMARTIKQWGPATTESVSAK
jgi:hypothetical protein